MADGAKIGITLLLKQLLELNFLFVSFTANVVMYLQTHLASIKINLDNLFSSKDLRFAWLNDAVLNHYFYF